MKNKEELYNLVKIHAYRYREEPFLLSSGLLSHHYFNCKEITLHPERLSLLTKVMVEEWIPSFSQKPPEAVGGLTMGADPICYGLALEYLTKGHLVYPLIVRKETKDHGTKKRIEGFPDKVQSCLVVDDVVTTGGSTLKAVEALREVGIEVRDAICILDREEGGRENLLSHGIQLHSLFQKSEFLKG